MAVMAVRIQERLATGFADHVLTVTEEWQRTLVSRGVRPDRVDVVMNVADEGIFSPSARNARPPDGVFLLLYHGTVAHRYGLDIAIRAIAQVADRVPAHLLIHGNGDVLEELKALTRQLGVDDHVTFSTSHLSTPELAKLVGSADVGIVPNRSDIFTDGILPTKLMEYAAVGIPAIASRTPAIARYFDEDMVRLVEPGAVDDLAEAILDLYRDPGACERLAAGIRRFAEAQSFQHQAETYLRVVRALHARPSQRPASRAG
jgi:glycosyltransferase involved in cell wall biosynthesis